MGDQAPLGLADAGVSQRGEAGALMRLGSSPEQQPLCAETLDDQLNRFRRMQPRCVDQNVRSAAQRVQHANQVGPHALQIDHADLREALGQRQQIGHEGAIMPIDQQDGPER